MTGPLVVLEGPDGGGKTTLAEAFVKRGFEYVHCGPPERDACQNWLEFIDSATGPTVFDRLHVGSYAYGHVFRAGDDLTEYERWLIDGTLVSANTVTIFCDSDSDTLNGNLKRGPDNADAVVYEAADKREAVRERFREFFNDRYTLPWRRYDFTEGNMDEVVESALRMLDIAGMPAPIVNVDIPTLGDTVIPKFAFVGEQPHCNVRAMRRARQSMNPDRFLRLVRAMSEVRSQAPFSDSPSGRYLHQSLSSAHGFSLHDYCVVNALQLDGRRLEEFVSPSSVVNTAWVALGRTAEREIERAGIRSNTWAVPHPQHVKRFHYKRGLTEYHRALFGIEPWDCGVEGTCKGGVWG